MTAGSPSDRRLATATYSQTEAFPLTIFALAGMMLFAGANDLLLMFVALEVLSLPLYLLCALARRRRLLSQEAAVKYFLFGAFASAFFLYGVALLYGYAGTVNFGGIFEAATGSANDDILLFLGLACSSSACCSRPASRPSTPGLPMSTKGHRHRSRR